MFNSRKVIFHPAILIPALLVSFLATALLAKIFIWPVFSNIQAGKSKAKALVLIEQGDYPHAFVEIRNAISKNPTDVSSYKIALQAIENSPDHYQYIPNILQQLMKMEPDNAEHYYKFILIALQIKQLDQAETAFKDYPEKAKNSEEYHRMGYSLGLATNNTERADYHLSKLLELNPQDTKLLFTLSTLRLNSSKDEAIIAGAKEALEKLSSTENSRLPALRALLSHSLVEKDSANVIRYIKEMSSLESLGTSDSLLILQAQKSVAPDSFEALVENFLKEDMREPQKIGLTLDFLIKNDLLDRASKWAETFPEEILSEELVNRRVSQIYYLTQNWDKLRGILLDENWEKQEFGRLLLLALTSKVQGDTLAFRKYWQQCLMEVGSNREYLKSLFQTTVKWEWQNESIEVLEKSFHQEPGDNEIFNMLVNHFMNSGETGRALEILGRRVEFVSDDLGSKNNLALLSILKGTNQSNAFAYARDNYLANKANPFFITTWAFALQKQDRLQEAEEVLRQLTKEEQNNPQRAVYLAKIYAELGNLELAQEFLDRVDQESLFVEEKNLLFNLQKSLKKASE